MGAETQNGPKASHDAHLTKAWVPIYKRIELHHSGPGRPQALPIAQSGHIHAPLQVHYVLCGPVAGLSAQMHIRPLLTTFHCCPIHNLQPHSFEGRCRCLAVTVGISSIRFCIVCRDMSGLVSSALDTLRGYAGSIA